MLHETERAGEAFSGPKRWHTFDILTRQVPVTSIIHESSPEW